MQVRIILCFSDKILLVKTGQHWSLPTQELEQPLIPTAQAIRLLSQLGLWATINDLQFLRVNASFVDFKVEVPPHKFAQIITNDQHQWQEKEKLGDDLRWVKNLTPDRESLIK